MSRQPLAIDLFCGLGGWTDGLLAEGYRVRGYDIEAHEYDGEKYPAELVLQDVMALNGADLAADPDLTLIVASPPCQEYSYMAMPWSRAKAKAAAIRADETGEALKRLNALFDACFRIQREASEAAGRYIPMVVENVRGAQPWVGRAAWNFGSFYLWGDVPALMPIATHRKNDELGGGSWFNIGSPGQKVVGANPDGRKNPGFRFDGSGKSFQSESVARHVADGLKLRDQDGYERTHPNAFGWKAPRTTSKGKARKAASAKIAKIPLTLSQYIARHYLQSEQAAA